MTASHRLLDRQLRRLGIGEAAPDQAQWAALRATVAGAYRDADEDRDTLERSLTISSRELREVNADLARSSASRLAQQHDQLLASNAIKDAVLEASPDGILVIDADRKVAICNRRFAEIWRIPVELVDAGDDRALLGAALAQLVDPGAFLAKVEALYAAPNACSEDELALRDGRRLERFSRPALDADGVARGRLWIFRDVTARRQDESRLRDAHAFLDSIIETLPNMVFVKDAAELRFVRFNRAGEQLLGVDRAAILGKHDHDLFSPAHADAFVAKDREVLAQRDAVTIGEEEVETKHGLRRLRTRKIAILDADDQPAYLLGISEDITDERARAAELSRARERAELASRAKSDFLLNMSHELRTPLNAILGFARILHRTTRARLTDDERQHLADITAAGDHMLRLVNDLLDLRSLEANQLDLGAVELAAPLAEAVRMVQPLIRDRGQRLTVAAAADLPACLGERRAIVQVLINLLSNAAKFTPGDGRIAVTADRDGDRVVVRIADTGIGIAPHDQARLFQYFVQLDGKADLPMKGSGVGLALTRSLVEKMGGTVAVTSEVGVGSTFEVRLKVAA